MQNVVVTVSRNRMEKSGSEATISHPHTTCRGSLLHTDFYPLRLKPTQN